MLMLRREKDIVELEVQEYRRYSAQISYVILFVLHVLLGTIGLSQIIECCIKLSLLIKYLNNYPLS